MKGVLPRANPLALLAVGLTAVVGSFFVGSATAGGLTVLLYAAIAGCLVPQWQPVRWRLVAVGIAAVSLWWSTWLLGGHDPGLATEAATRVLVLALPGAVLMAFVDPSRLGDALRQQLRLPGRPVAAFTAALTRFETLGQVWEQVRQLRRMRGMGAGRNPFAQARATAATSFTLLVSAMRGATQLSIAMDSRGFRLAHHRTSAHDSAWSAGDTVLLIGGIVATIVVPVALSIW